MEVKKEINTERNKYQKKLNVFAIIEFIAGVVNILLGILSLTGGGFAASKTGEIINQGVATAEEVGQVSGLFIGLGVASIITGIIHFVEGLQLKKVVNDATQFKGAQIIVCIALLISVINLVVSIIAKKPQDISSYALSLAIDCYVMYLILKVKEGIKA